MSTIAAPRWRKFAVEVLVLLGILAGWIALQVWVLPKLGVPT